MIRRLFAASAAIAVATAASANLLMIGVGQVDPGIYAALTPPTVLPQPSAYFTYDNAQNASLFNVGLKLNGGVQGAAYVPASVTKSWFEYIEGEVDANSGGTVSATEYALTGSATLIGCSSLSCSSGTDRFFGISTNSLGGSVRIGGRANGTSSLWKSNTVISATFLAGSGYNNGLWQWTAQGSGCATPPSGYVHAGYTTSGAIGDYQLTYAGQGCPTGTFTVTAGMAGSSFTGTISGTTLTISSPTGTTAIGQPVFGAGVTPGTIITGGSGTSWTVNNSQTVGPVAMTTALGGISSNTIQTLTFGPGPGVLMPPSTHFCAAVVQYGTDTTGVYSNFHGYISGTTLTVTSTESGAITVGQTIQGGGVTAGTYIVSGGSGSYVVNNSQTVGSVGTPSALTTTMSGQQAFIAVDQAGNPLVGSPSLSTTVNNASSAAGFYYSAPGTIMPQSSIGDIFNLIGSGSSTSTTASQSGWGGRLANYGMIWGELPWATAQATLAQICTRSANTDPLVYFKATYTDANIRSFYKLNDAAAVPPWADSSVGKNGINQSWDAATPLLAGYPKAGGQAVSATALTLDEYPDYTVHSVSSVAAGTGPIRLSGTYSTGVLGGTPGAIQAQVTTGPNGTGTVLSPWTNLASASITGGVWSGYTPAIAAGGPYYVQVRPANGTSYVISSPPVQVGMIFSDHGQSQQESCSSPAQVGSVIQMPSGATSPYVHQNTSSYSASIAIAGAGPLIRYNARQMTENSFNSGSLNVPMGDCSVAMIWALRSVSGGWPVEFINLARGGRAVETWTNSRLPQVQTSGITGGGTTALSGTLTLSYANIPSSTPGAALLNNANVSMMGSGVQEVLAGSMVVYDGATQIAHEVAPADPTNGNSYTAAGNCVIDNASYGTVGAPVTCSLNYLTGAFSIGQSPNPFSRAVTTPSIGWTNITDEIPTSAIGLANGYSYMGYDNVGAGAAAPSSGLFSALMSLVPGPLTAMLMEQCDANAGSFSAYSTAAPSHTGKWSYILAPMLASRFPIQMPSTTPIISLGYPRYVNTNTYTSTFNQNQGGCQVWQMDFAGLGTGNTFQGANPVYYGGDYYDHTVGTGALVNSGPHESQGIYGGQRMGRRKGISIWNALSGISAAPTIASAAFDLTSTYSSSCAAGTGTPYSCINFTFTLAPGATALQTCGPDLQGAAATETAPTGQCVPTGVGATVEGFRIGSSQAMTTTAGSPYDDGMDPQLLTTNGGGAAFTNGQFQCTIVAANIVQCRKTNGAWTSGFTYASYGDITYSVGRYRSLVWSPTGASLPIGGSPVGGSGYTDGVGYTLTATGGGCTVEPSVTLKVVGGQIVSAVPKTLGARCSSAPTFPTINGTSVTGIGTPSVAGTVTLALCSGTGTPSVPCIATEASDNRLMGELLYDDQGRVGGPYNSILYSPSTGFQMACPAQSVTGGNVCEPGLPVRPFGLLTGVPVSG